MTCEGGELGCVCCLCVQISFVRPAADSQPGLFLLAADQTLSALNKTCLSGWFFILLNLFLHKKQKNLSLKLNTGSDPLHTVNIYSRLHVDLHYLAVNRPTQKRSDAQKKHKMKLRFGEKCKSASGP